MSLTQAQKSLIEKARSVGGSEMAVPIDDAAGTYLLARTVTDLGLQAHFADALIRHAPTRLPDMSARDTGTSVVLEVGGESLVVERDAAAR